ncbi:MAG: hypothetical protein R6V85_14480 [Polyangia bacterium]
MRCRKAKTSPNSFGAAKPNSKSRGVEPVNWDEVKRTWLDDLEKLFENIRGWLETAVEEDLIEMTTGEVQISEDHLGMYKAPRLAIDLGDTTVDVVPAFRITAGAEGRVDVFCGANKAVLLRTGEGAWGIAVHFSGSVQIETLNENSFRDLLEDLTT